MHLTDLYCSGELLLDQQRFQDAIEKFDRAIELEKAKSVFLVICRFFDAESEFSALLPIPCLLSTKHSQSSNGVKTFRVQKRFAVKPLSWTLHANLLSPHSHSSLSKRVKSRLRSPGLRSKSRWQGGKQRSLLRSPTSRSVHVYILSNDTDAFFQASKAQLLFIRNYPRMAEQLTQIARGMI